MTSFTILLASRLDAGFFVFQYLAAKVSDREETAMDRAIVFTNVKSGLTTFSGLEFGVWGLGFVYLTQKS